MGDVNTVQIGTFRSGLHNVDAKIGTPTALLRNDKTPKETPRIIWLGVNLDDINHSRSKSGKEILARTDGIKSVPTSLTKQVALTLLVFPEADI